MFFIPPVKLLFRFLFLALRASVPHLACLGGEKTVKTRIFILSFPPHRQAPFRAIQTLLSVKPANGMLSFLGESVNNDERNGSSQKQLFENQNY